MSPIDPVKQPVIGGRNIIAWVAIALSFLAILVVLFRPPVRESSQLVSADRWEQITKNGVLRVGYGGYPPYTIASADSKSAPPVSGFSVDLVNAIANRANPKLKVEWYQFSFDTMKADLASGRFDFIADPVFMTVPRAQDFSFSKPYSTFGIAVALVRANDNRFNTFRDLDRPDITIALAEGWTSSDFAKATLSKPKFKSIPVTGDALAQMDEVLSGHADVALNDVPTVLQYVRAHSGKVKALWLDTPPSRVQGAFLLRPQDRRLNEFLSNSIVVLEADGTVSQIDKKWKSLGYFEKVGVTPGAGISDNQASPSK